MTDNLRCDVCGQWIGWQALECGRATRRLVTPDSEFTKEEYETLCEKCNETDSGEAA